MIIRRNLKPSIILRNIWRPVLVTTALAGVAVYKFANWGQTLLHVPLGAVAMLSGALAIFLAFRNASSYDRWWEARKLWGSLVNLSRTFAREVLTFVAPDQQDAQPLRRSLVLRAAAFAHALRFHLRKQPELMVELSGLLPDAELAAVRASKNAPNQLLLNQGRALAAAYAQGLLNDFRHIQLEQTLRDLTDVLGACERIKNTPLPRQYDYFPRIFLWFYMAVLPFGMVHDLGVFTPLMSVPISIIFVVLEGVGRLNEDPFENRITDTPMSALSRTIEINLKEMLGDQELPPPVEAVDGFLF